MMLFFYLATAGTLFCGVFFLALLVFTSTSSSTRRVLEVTTSAQVQEDRMSRWKRVQQTLLRMVRKLRAKIRSGRRRTVAAAVCQRRAAWTGPRRKIFCGADARSCGCHCRSELYSFQHISLGCRRWLRSPTSRRTSGWTTRSRRGENGFGAAFRTQSIYWSSASMPALVSIRPCCVLVWN